MEIPLENMFWQTSGKHLAQMNNQLVPLSSSFDRMKHGWYQLTWKNNYNWPNWNQMYKPNWIQEQCYVVHTGQTNTFPVWRIVKDFYGEYTNLSIITKNPNVHLYIIKDCFMNNWDHYSGGLSENNVFVSNHTMIVISFLSGLKPYCLFSCSLEVGLHYFLYSK